MSRTRRFLGGVSFGYVNQLLVTVVGLWLTPFLLGRIGQHDYGLWLVGTQFMAYLMLMDFGVVALLPRETAFATGRAGGGRAELPQLLGQTARIVLWQTPLVAVAAAALWLSMPAEWEPLRRPIALALAAFVLTFPLRIFQAVLQGLQDLEFMAKVQTCVWASSMALTVALVFAGWGLSALAAGWASAQFLTLPFVFYRLRRRFPDALPRGLPRLPWPQARQKLSAGFWVSINQIAVVLLAGADVLVIGKLLGPAAVVPYACTAKLVMVLANQPQMLMQAAIPALSELRTGARREHLSSVCTALSQAILLLSGAVVCVVLATNRGFVKWWVGAEQYGGLLLTALVLLHMLLRHLNLTVGIILFSFGYERRLALTGLLDGLLTVGATVLFTGLVGLEGAPLGSLLGLCLASLPLNLSALSGANAVPVSRLLKSLAPWCWRFALLALASGAFARRFLPDTFQALSATALAAAGVYTVVMLPLAWRDPLGAYVRPRLAPLAGRFFRVLQRRRSTA